MNPVMQSSAYVLEVRLKAEVDFESFFDWLWGQFGDQGLLGVHEGTVLSEEAAQQGMETESWTVDSAEAPRERDWVGAQNEIKAHLYFASLEEAQAATTVLKKDSRVEVGALTEQGPQDWDAQWKAAFLSSGDIRIPPFWRVVPPFLELESEGPDTRILKINPGAGFGTGTHETTQICLEAIGGLLPEISRERALDFGSGSGILAAGMGLLGAKVDAVEIDPLAIENALENARLNGVEGRISFSQDLSSAGSDYYCVVANILKPVLLEYAGTLTARLRRPGGTLILSGLIEKDVKDVLDCYSALLKGSSFRVIERAEWRGIVLRA